ncbi:unnamed protein product [Ceutorhynchus assimilis]|uniref:Peptidase S1 domain-containing protein n=1 Tax=Ceutorhynchus assimilis TaxID=467358 RepID=A0A9P0DV56_9CUCU|nr:unnamed protein product [Ceutorhynchus assimilis]CAH1183214.1 unnamed protein product [Ceutorhynchus assimilis]
MNVLCFVFGLGAWLWQETQQKTISPRIINGEKVSIKDYPYQVGLEITYHDKSELLQCGGALISKKHILTAAHCFNFRSEDPEIVTVLMGSDRSIKTFHEEGKLQSGAQLQRCRKCWRNHPKFEPVTYKNDISIITLEHEIELSSQVQPISLPKRIDLIHNMVNKPAVVSGWGLTENREASDTLRAINVTLTNQYCPEKTLCYIPVNNKSECKGDSGGPIVIEKKVVGIVSHYDSGDKKMDPTFCEQSVLIIQTNVANHLDWIQTVTKIPVENFWSALSDFIELLLGNIEWDLFLN